MTNDPNASDVAFSTLESRGKRKGWARLSWLPLALLMPAILVLWAVNLRTPHESDLLLLVCNILFSTVASFFVAVMVGRSYLVRGSPAMLLFGCGVIIWGVAGTLGTLLMPRGVNVTITTHNALVWCAALCHLTGALLSLRQYRAPRLTGLTLAMGYAGALSIVWLVIMLSLENWFPVFLNGDGGTPLRSFVLGSAAGMFVFTAAILWRANRPSPSSFVRWYAGALLLIATGLIGIMLEQVIGGWLSWTGRIAQFLGGGYMLAAAIVSVRETAAVGMSLNAALRASEERYRDLFDSMVEGFAVHEIITDNRGRPVDYRFLDINPAFERLTGLKRGEVVGRRVLEVLPAAEPFWIARYGHVALTGEPARFESFTAALSRWYEVFAFRPAPGKFAVLFSDITARKQAEQLLREANERLEMTQRAAGVGTWDWDIAASKLEWSPRLFELFGLDPATTPASFEAWKSALHPDDSATASESIERALAEKANLDSEYRVVRPDKQVRWINALGQGTYDANGRPIRMAGICIDITERKQVQEAIARSEREFRELAESMPHIVWSTRADGLNTYFNRQWMDYTGLTLEESHGHGWNKPFHPDDQQRAWDAWQTAVQQNARYSLQCRLRRADGVYCWWWIQGVPVLDENGRITKWYGTCIDIHEMKQAEEAARQSREDLSRAQAVGQIGSWRLDTRRDILTWSDENHRIFGLPQGTPMSYETFLGTIHPDDRQYVDTQWQAAVRGEPYDIEHRIVVAGQIKWVREKAYLEFDAAGALLGGFGITHDITERKRVGEELRQLNETLERRVTERTEEARQLSDQLRALASDLSQTEQRERKRLATILHDHIQQLLVAAKMQLGLVTRADSKTVASTVQGVESIIKEAIDASRTLAVELSPPILHQAGLAAGLNWLANRKQEENLFKVHVRASSDAEPASENMRFLLFESVRELLLNAVKHSGVHEARVTMIRTPDGWTKIIVEDKGKGFDFALVRARQADSESFGLFGIQQRLNHLGGRLEIESAPGQGTRAVLSCPPGKAEAATEEPAVAAPAAGGQEVMQLRRKAQKIGVLLVDDHKIVLQGLTSILQFESDIEIVAEAADGKQAVELARQHRPDVIIMDVNMPVMGGVEATRIIMQELPQSKVLALSMHIDQDVASDMRKAGAIGYLTKGGPSEDLVSAIRACVRQQTTAS